MVDDSDTYNTDSDETTSSDSDGEDMELEEQAHQTNFKLNKKSKDYCNTALQQRIKQLSEAGFKTVSKYRS